MVEWTDAAIEVANNQLMQGNDTRAALNAAVNEQELLPSGTVHRHSFVAGLNAAADLVSSITTEMTASEVADAIRRLA